ncbi:MAG: glycosyltransferase, partial [Anaerolineae bacterium]|nr:glycosyltransferase [Anaerolineae bacterium]
MRPKRIAICATQVPFVRGGAEIHVESLQRELIQRGFETELIRLPFKWHPHSEIIKGALAWRLLDLTESDGQKIDMVIATKFPSYTVKHPHKVVWLIHQFRQAYELYGTPYSNLTNTPEDRRIRDMIHSADARTLGEARRIFTIAQNTTNRLARYNQLHGEALYHPPKLDGLYHNEQYGNYIFSIGRLDKMKRVALLIEAMQHTRTGVRCLIAGSGREREPLQKMIEKMVLGHRVTLLGYVDDKRQVELYANC